MLLDPIRAVADFSFYRQVPKKSFGATVGYIAYVALIYALTATLAVHLRVKPLITEAVDWASQSFPTLTLADGRLSTTPPSDRPLEIRNPRVPDLLVIIDANRTAPLAPAEMLDSKAQVYLTQSAAYLFNPANRKMEVYDLAAAKGKEKVVVDAQTFRRLGGVFSAVLDPATFACSWVFSFIRCHFWALIYTIVALLLNSFLAGGLQFEQLYRIAVYAQTPAVVLQIVAIIVWKSIPFDFLLGLMLVGVYLWRAIRQNGTLPHDEVEGPAVP
jgi:hypothetical protein